MRAAWAIAVAVRRMGNGPATAFWEDGPDKNFMLLGLIRYRYTSKDMAKGQSFFAVRHRLRQKRVESIRISKWGMEASVKGDLDALQSEWELVDDNLKRRFIAGLADSKNDTKDMVTAPHNKGGWHDEY